MRKKTLIISLLILFIDQISKIIMSNLNINKILIPNFLSFKYAQNTGVAFSMLSNSRILILIISAILLIFVFSIMKKEYLNKNEIIYDIYFGLLVGGILGNFIDRLLRGYVIDFISLKLFKYYFPIFNIADLSITIGIIALIIIELKKRDGDKAK